MPHYSGIVTPRERPHFLHIGKTGGAAVKHALKPVAAAGHLMLHGHDVRLHDVAPGEQVFFFLRDPLSRFVSAFYSRQREGRPRYVVPWTPDEEAAFGRFRTANELADGLSSTSAAELMSVMPSVTRRSSGLRRATERNGGQGVGLFSCSKATNEMNFIAQKFMRQVLSSNNIDSCNRT